MHVIRGSPPHHGILVQSFTGVIVCPGVVPVDGSMQLVHARPIIRRILRDDAIRARPFGITSRIPWACRVREEGEQMRACARMRHSLEVFRNGSFHQRVVVEHDD